MCSLQTLPDSRNPGLAEVARLESQVRRCLGNRVRNLSVCWHDDGWLLEGTSVTYHAKQLAQQAVMEATPLPLRANRIQVLSRTSRIP